MKLIIGCLLAALINIHSGHKTNQIPLNEVEFLNGKYLRNGKPITGEIVDYFENNQLKIKYKVIDGRLHGEAKSFYPTGTLKNTRNYTFSKLFGTYTDFNEAGEPIIKFDVDLNAYGKGENVLNVEIRKGKKLKNRGAGVIFFVSKDDQTFNSSEQLSLLDETIYYINDSKGEQLYKNY